MRNLILSAVIFASAFQTALGQIVEGQWTYIVENGGATITASTATGDVTIPSVLGGYAVKKVGNNWPPIFGSPNTSVTSIVIPNSVTSIGDWAFDGCNGLTSIVLPSPQTLVGINAIPGLTARWYSNQLSSLAMDSTFGTALASNSAFVTALANNDAFVTAVANKIKGTEGNYGIATQNQLTTTQAQLASTQTQLATTQAQLETIAPTLTDSLPFVNAIAVKIKGQEGNFGIATQAQLESTQTQLATTQAELANTKSQITTAINEGKASGIASVTASPNTWSLFTTSQIQNMAVGDLVLTRQVSGGFVLNYDIEQSTDLQTWTTYAPLSLPLTGLPTDKAFVRIKMINSTPNPPPSTAIGGNL
jgi:hypothetical protein